MEIIEKNIKKDDDRRARLALRFDLPAPGKSFGTDFVNTCVGHALTSFYGSLGSAKFSIQIVEIDQLERTATIQTDLM